MLQQVSFNTFHKIAVKIRFRRVENNFRLKSCIKIISNALPKLKSTGNRRFFLKWAPIPQFESTVTYINSDTPTKPDGSYLKVNLHYRYYKATARNLCIICSASSFVNNAAIVSAPVLMMYPEVMLLAQSATSAIELNLKMSFFIGWFLEIGERPEGETTRFAETE